ncbi:MAG: hemerythrin family protein [Deltaproteobacteria bacterium]|nr:hemerythrin family protein [Deltaproteobacteria bacterium]
MALTWQKSLETGIDWQDTQHKGLFASIDKLLKAMLDNRGKEELTNLIKFLDRYVVEHFGAEDQTMTRLNYSEKVSHMAEHRVFKEKIATIKKEVEKGVNPATVIALQQQSTRWLINHIGSVDKKLGEFIKSKAA